MKISLLNRKMTKNRVILPRLCVSVESEVILATMPTVEMRNKHCCEQMWGEKADAVTEQR